MCNFFLLVVPYSICFMTVMYVLYDLLKKILKSYMKLVNVIKLKCRFNCNMAIRRRLN